MTSAPTPRGRTIGDKDGVNDGAYRYSICYLPRELPGLTSTLWGIQVAVCFLEPITIDAMVAGEPLKMQLRGRGLTVFDHQSLG
jgi:hypothetical protein